MKTIQESIKNSWTKIAPFWPLKNLIAVNPLAGFTHLTFEKALTEASAYFQSKTIPQKMLEVNHQTIKWLQIFFDKGEAKISMPLRERGLLSSICTLLIFDKQISLNKTTKELLSFSNNPEKLIVEVLKYLQILDNDHEQFLTLLLTTLPGWASYTQYRVTWGDPAHPNHPHPITHAEYLAFRILLTAIIWPEAQQLLPWHKQNIQQANTKDTYNSILEKEAKYQKELLYKLNQKIKQTKQSPDAQLIFCIDIRSEPLRKKIETLERYETFSMAGFFGLPIIIKNKSTGLSYAACTPLISPEYTITQTETDWNKKYVVLEKILLMYQSIKYTFATPFALAEIAGPAKGFWMLMRNFFPSIINKIKYSVFCHYNQYDLSNIPLEKQIEYAKNTLKTIGLTTFAPVVIFCGHKSRSKNNIYETILDCGACAGRSGFPNAQIIVQILKKEEVRKALNIPDSTQFFAGKHNTTNDTLSIFKQDAHSVQEKIIDTLINSLTKDTTKEKQSLDWSQPRPEWGLARNASLIIGPRWITQNIDLDGRTFLHSYDHEQDIDGSILKNIITGPVVVAHWINAQYLFSTINNTAFGGGSKITANVVGKIGVMQGNASDLMTGLALQSVNKTDNNPYHEAIRLTVYIYAQQKNIDQIIQENKTIKELVENEWIFIKTITF